LGLAIHVFIIIFNFSGLFYWIKNAKFPKSKKKRIWFWLSIVVNLGFLGFFKYYNFFAESFAESVSYFGWKISPVLLKVILPVGISFYTFHGLSYVIDIYKNKIKAESNFVDYAVFVSFFPLLVAGPIERATHLLPQIKKEGILIMHKQQMVCDKYFGDY
jgi:D-alanyl-lipoteichoic acid acyltransferase DltB (MBOAT superfamily)